LTFETLQYTIAADDGEIRKLKAFAAQRGTATYDAAGAISAGQLRGAIRSAQELYQRVVAWLRERHPELLQA
jgi:1,2-phenylacetyl-CoA epoxidase PaaB subunit